MGLTSARAISTSIRSLEGFRGATNKIASFARKGKSSVSAFTLESEGLLSEGIQLESTQAHGLTSSIELTDHAFTDDVRLQLEKQLQLPDWTNLVEGREAEGSTDICLSTPDGKSDYFKAINGFEVSDLRNPKGDKDIDPANEKGKAEFATFFRNLKILDPDRAGESVQNQIVKFNRKEKLNSTDENKQQLEALFRKEEFSDVNLESVKLGLERTLDISQSFHIDLNKNIEMYKVAFQEATTPEMIMGLYKNFSDKAELPFIPHLDHQFRIAIINYASAHKSMKDIEAVRLTVKKFQDLKGIDYSSEIYEVNNIFNQLKDEASLTAGFFRSVLGFEQKIIEENLPNNIRRVMDRFYGHPEHNNLAQNMTSTKSIAERIFDSDLQLRADFLKLQENALFPVLQSLRMIDFPFQAAISSEKSANSNNSSFPLEMKQVEVNSDSISLPVSTKLEALTKYEVRKSDPNLKFEKVQSGYIISADARTSFASTESVLGSQKGLRVIQSLIALMCETSEVVRFEGDGMTGVIPDKSKIIELQKIIHYASSKYGVNIRLAAIEATDPNCPHVEHAVDINGVHHFNGASQIEAGTKNGKVPLLNGISMTDVEIKAFEKKLASFQEENIFRVFGETSTCYVVGLEAGENNRQIARDIYAEIINAVGGEKAELVNSSELIISNKLGELPSSALPEPVQIGENGFIMNLVLTPELESVIEKLIATNIQSGKWSISMFGSHSSSKDSVIKIGDGLVSGQDHAFAAAQNGKDRKLSQWVEAVLIASNKAANQENFDSAYARLIKNRGVPSDPRILASHISEKLDIQSSQKQ